MDVGWKQISREQSGMTIEITNVYCKLNVKWIKNIKDYIEWIKIWEKLKN